MKKILSLFYCSALVFITAGIGFSALVQEADDTDEILSYAAEEPQYESEESDGIEESKFASEGPTAEYIAEYIEDADVWASAYESSDMRGALSYTIYEEVDIDPSRYTWNMEIPSDESQTGNHPPVVEESAIVSEEFYPESVYFDEGDYDLDDDLIYDNMFFDIENAEQLAAKRTPDEIVIKFRNAAEMPGFERQLQREIDKVQKLGFVEELGLYVVEVEDLENDPNAVLNRLKNNRFVEFVEPNYTLDFSFEPDDPYYGVLKGVFEAINAPAGWEVTKGIGSSKIAIIDSGVVADHEDLPKKLLSGYSAVTSLAYNNDKVGHGTKVAGVLGAVGNNKKGIPGINWNAQIMPVKVDTLIGTITVANLAKGIIWATDNGAKVINLSLGMATDSATMKSAIDYAYNKGVAIFAATGNASRNAVDYPARYKNVMGVGATTDGKKMADFSNYGTGLDVVAIGSYYTTTATGGYASASGTSFATPQVAGLASLIYPFYPNAKNDGADAAEWVYDQIRQAAKPLNNGAGRDGYGLIDIGETLARVVNKGNADNVAEAKGCTAPPSLELNSFAGVILTVGDSYHETGYTATDCFESDITSNVKISGSLNTSKEGVYKLTYTVTDDNGNTVQTVRTVTVVAKPAKTPTVITPPTMTILGANPIILHLNSSTPYIEQGVLAIDGDGEDISGYVEIHNELVRNQAGVYFVDYRVTGKSGGEATAQREVWVIAPALEKIVRTPYGLSGQGKQGMKVTHTGIVASNAGWMDLRLSNIDKNMVALVQMVNPVTRDVVVEDVFSAAGTKQYKVNAGRYDLAVTIGKAVGNSKYTLNLLMPEVIESQFKDAEVYQ